MMMMITCRNYLCPADTAVSKGKVFSRLADISKAAELSSMAASQVQVSDIAAKALSSLDVPAWINMHHRSIPPMAPKGVV